MVRNRAALFLLLSLIAITLYLCGLMLKPFIKPIVSALVMAIVFHPVHGRIRRFTRSPSAAALLSIILVLLVIIIPTFLLGRAISRELTDLYQSLSQKSAGGGGLSPYLLTLVEKAQGWMGRHAELSKFDLRAVALSRLEEATAFSLKLAAGLVGNATSLVVNAVISFIVLFFLFREGGSMLRRVAAALPLQAEQISQLFQGVNDTVIATVYGVLAVAAVQGALTGLAFRMLGLPSPILWGLVTAMFCLVPVVGTGAVWVPASIILAMSGHWGRGLILLAWGTAVVHPIDNIVRPYLIGGRVKLHGLYVFFALLGGLQAFGVIGLFVGPVLFSVTIALLGILRQEGWAWEGNWREKSSPNLQAIPKPVEISQKS